MGTITTAFKNTYSNNVTHLAQQKVSRLRRSVDNEPSPIGEKKFLEQYGEREMQPDTVRYGDSPHVAQEHFRRMITLADYDDGQLIDDKDKLRTLNDPTNPIVVGMGRAAGRKIDDVVIAAASGTAYTGKDGTVTADLTSANQVASTFVPSGSPAASGLTVPKIIRAAGILDAFEVDEDDPRFFWFNGKAKEALLNTTQVTSIDYNTVKALHEGRVDEFMGFTFIRSERLAHNAGTDVRTCIALVKSGVRLAFGQEPKGEIDPSRSDKKFNAYAYYKMSLGAVRMEEKKVVEVFCDESP